LHHFLVVSKSVVGLGGRFFWLAVRVAERETQSAKNTIYGVRGEYKPLPVV
jgi:hypothetical protein